MRRLPDTETLLNEYSFYPLNESQTITYNEIMSSIYVSDYIHSDDDSGRVVIYARNVISCIAAYLIITSSSPVDTEPDTYTLTYDLNDYIDACDALEIPHSSIPTRTETDISSHIFAQTIVNYINRSMQQFGVLFDMWYDVEYIDLISAQNENEK